MMKHLLTALLALSTGIAAAHAGDTACLRGDNIDRIKMVDADAATASDRDKHAFGIKFVAPCGARHQNVYFVLRPESLPQCIVAGTALPTNREGVCVIKSIVPQG